jgi:hypothetical protein
MKAGPDALGTTKNESESGKLVTEPSVPPKTSPREQTMKIGPDAHSTAQN